MTTAKQTRKRTSVSNRLKRLAVAFALTTAAPFGCYTHSENSSAAGGDAQLPTLASSDAGAPACPNDLPANCPSPAPTYAEVAPIFQRTCLPCHGPGGSQVATLDYTTYAKVKSQQIKMFGAFYQCVMPEADSGITVTPSERATLLAWFVCDAPP